LYIKNYLNWQTNEQNLNHCSALSKSPQRKSAKTGAIHLSHSSKLDTTHLRNECVQLLTSNLRPKQRVNQQTPEFQVDCTPVDFPGTIRSLSHVRLQKILPAKPTACIPQLQLKFVCWVIFQVGRWIMDMPCFFWTGLLF